MVHHTQKSKMRLATGFEQMHHIYGWALTGLVECLCKEPPPIPT